MYLLRSVTENDLEELFKLSQLANFINLPPKKEIILQKIKRSIESFSNENSSKNLNKDYYLFIIENTETRNVIGASMIHAQHGTHDEPHFFLKVSQEHKFSNTINTGFIHGTLKLGLDMDGPSEIGGLIINPSFRGNPNKLGKQISFVRFLYIGLKPHKFKEEIHCELLPPFDNNGNSPLWEAIGRRFLNMNYHEADLLSRNNKEFILSLFPSDTIYEALLPLEARNAIGKVGTDTLPVKKIIESIGFRYVNEVDPFDGGPHYRCKRDEITLIQEMESFQIKPSSKDQVLSHSKLIELRNNYYQFSAAVFKCFEDFENKILYLSPELIKVYHFNENQSYYAINF